MRKRIILLNTVFYLISFTSFSQILNFTDLNSDFYQLRVKTPEEFIMRFNYEQTPDGKILKYNDSLKKNRFSLIHTLFDTDLLAKAQKNDTLANTIVDFIKETVLDSTQFLTYYSKKWYAQVDCKILYKNKHKKLSLFLQTEINNRKEAKWVIIDCKSDLFSLIAKDSTQIIGPVNHNLNFMELLKMSKFYPKSVINYKSEGFGVDNLSIFYYLVYNSILKIEDIEEINFHFYQIPGYYFTVKNIQRDSSNSGWLITEIKKVDIIMDGNIDSD